ncbi:hypothetical protein [Pseudomonas koreensis]|uniref:ASCH domain-containing protein n=1 Tax=Pseudomonas koreensis TaxID=198620 RepID=A0A9X2XGA3_9PSED|nr:hypothetical protein [Pseudomonas koreensis]MCU7247962.1 hypothetical protein [Pseudomonas koreensis]
MTAIKERPILFSAPMVRAILEGRKTVTRRPVKGGQIPVEDTSLSVDDHLRWSAIGQRDPRYGFDVYGVTADECASELAKFGRCPYGQPGDRLWVREAWAADEQMDSIAPRYLSQGEPILYPTDGAVRQTGCSMITRGRGRLSIHMPRRANRILLEITDVRVERLQDISAEQAKAEGVNGLPRCRSIYPDDDYLYPFKDLWLSINGPESWESNPWLWVVEFKRVQP